MQGSTYADQAIGMLHAPEAGGTTADVDRGYGTNAERVHRVFTTG